MEKELEQKVKLPEQHNFFQTDKGWGLSVSDCEDGGYCVYGKTKGEAEVKMIKLLKNDGGHAFECPFLNPPTEL